MPGAYPWSLDRYSTHGERPPCPGIMTGILLVATDDHEDVRVLAGVDAEVVPSELTADDIVLGMIAVLEIIAEVLLAMVEVVKPEISPPSTERRMSPTNPSTTSEAPLLMLYPAGWA